MHYLYNLVSLQAYGHAKCAYLGHGSDIRVYCSQLFLELQMWSDCPFHESCVTIYIHSYPANEQARQGEH